MPHGVLDWRNTHPLDSQDLAAQLVALPWVGFENVPQHHAGPFDVAGFGEGAWAASLVRGSLGASSAAPNTQVLLCGGFAFGEDETNALIAEAHGANVVRVGWASGTTTVAGRYALHGALQDVLQGATRNLHGEAHNTVAVPLERSPFSAYRYAQSAAQLMQQHSQVQAAQMLLQELCERYRSEVASHHNKAKEIALALHRHTPLLLAPATHGLQLWAWQEHLARLGKRLALPVAHNAATLGASLAPGTLEGCVAVVIGGHDQGLRCIGGHLQRHCANVLVLQAPSNDPYCAALGLWYLGAWVGYYLALLNNTDPSDAGLLLELQTP